MAAAVIELDALSDAVWPAAQDHDLLAVAGAGLAGAFIVGIKIWSEAFELGSAGIHAAEDGGHAQLLAPVAHRDFIRAPGLAQLRVGDAVALGAAKYFLGNVRPGFLRQLAFEIHRSEERRVGKECRSRWSP